jgi:DNA mismatch repair protein PMS2
VRLLCTNITSKGSKSVVLKTQGSSSLKDNIINVFGLNTFQCLAPLQLTLSDGCLIEGFLSKPGNGNGRNSGDRQFFYVNSRPVDMPKVIKMVNELYRGSNSKQYPIAILNFCLPTNSYDVNVTPDKRKVFFSSEGSLMASLREKLENVYSPDQCVYSVNSVDNTKGEVLDDMDIDDTEEAVAPCKVSSCKKDILPREFTQLTPEVHRPEGISAYQFVDLKKSSGSTEELGRDGSSSRKLGIVQSSLTNFVSVNKRKHEDKTARNPISEVPVLRKSNCSEFCQNEVTENDTASESGQKRFQVGLLERGGGSAMRSNHTNSSADIDMEHDLVLRNGRKLFHSSTEGKLEEFEFVSKSNTKLQTSVGREVNDSVLGNRRRHFQFGTGKGEGPLLARCNNHGRDPDMVSLY